MPRLLATLAALLGASGVMAGAFGAHGLAGVLSPDALMTWETAARYQLFHAITLLVLTLSSLRDELVVACQLMFAGAVIFSGSLYVLVFTDISLFGAVTPVGGVLLITGWLVTAWQLWSKARPAS